MGNHFELTRRIDVFSFDRAKARMELLPPMVLREFLLSFFTVIFLTFSGLSNAAALEIRDAAGYITIEDGYYHLIDAANQHRIRLVPLTAAVKSALMKLKTHDYISGTIELVGQSYILHSVDSVGLRRILGIWQAGETYVEFQTFHALKFFNRDSTQYRYTLTPDEGSNWKVFLTNEDSVTLGVLSMNSLKNPSEMTFELFDSTSGSTVKKVHLKKVRK